jgi:glyoxylase-like metal-dependent hydrolase (beta-lactamase superfamily II)/8-oxo-dGTP pyrophosphatase MutT (NUDIX family)
VNGIAEAASVLLSRGPGSREVFVVRRAEQLRFFGGFFAFPGGKVCPADAQLSPATSGGGHERTLSARQVAAARELFEETGILVARHADGSLVPAEGLGPLRREMVERQLPFAEVLGKLGLTIWSSDFVPVGSLTTPDFTPLRFDTTFFVAHAPPGQSPHDWPGELDTGRWTTATELLDEWQRGQCLVSPPTLLLLESIRDRPVEAAPGRFAEHVHIRHAGAIPAIFFAPDVQMIPLHTQGLPPSTHTNAYLIGSGPVYLLDPGAIEPAEQQRLFDLLDAAAAGGKRLAAVLLTHHHPDHVGAANACAQRYAVPILGHAATTQAMQKHVTIARELVDGERLDLGSAPDGSGRWHLEAIHTPGHAAGHLAFYESHYHLLFAGDMISTLTSIIIPPDGDLAVYVDSLRRLLSYDCRLLLPSHGSPTARPRQTLEQAIEHRAQREEQLLAALRHGPRTATDLAGEFYKEMPPPVRRLAGWQVLAGLRKLQQEGRVVLIEANGEARWGLFPSP